MAELDEVRDGEDREDREEVTVETDGSGSQQSAHRTSAQRLARGRRGPRLTRTFLPALHFHLGLRVLVILWGGHGCWGLRGSGRVHGQLPLPWLDAGG